MKNLVIECIAKQHIYVCLYVCSQMLTYRGREVITLAKLKIRRRALLKIYVWIRGAVSGIYPIYSSRGLKGLHVIDSHISGQPMTIIVLVWVSRLVTMGHVFVVPHNLCSYPRNSIRSLVRSTDSSQRPLIHHQSMLPDDQCRNGGLLLHS